MTDDAAPPAGTQTAALLICRDLFFTSKITGTAQALGFRIETVTSREQALLRLTQGCRCVLLDLSFPDLPPADVMQALSAAHPTPVVAFGPHVATARLDAARAAGCVEVLPQSRLSATLPELLKRFLTG